MKQSLTVADRPQNPIRKTIADELRRRRNSAANKDQYLSAAHRNKAIRFNTWDALLGQDIKWDFEDAEFYRT